MNVALIPARGGSKRIPRKNIKLFNGKPIIAHVIETAKESGCFDRIIVSTDDEEIAEVAKKYGAEVPFYRPKELADDFATTAVVVSHALSWLIDHGDKPDYICVMYATAPFIEPETLQKSIALLEEQPNKHFCFSVVEFPSPIQRSFKISAEGNIEMFQPECFEMRSQDLEKAYHDAGQFYWGSAEGHLQDLRMYTSAAIPYVLPSYKVQDIDTPDDWIRAEAMHKVLNGVDSFDV